LRRAKTVKWGAIMRATIAAIMAALFVFSTTIVPAAAGNNSNGYHPWDSHGGWNNNDEWEGDWNDNEWKDPGHHDWFEFHGLICKIIIIKFPKWTPGRWDRHHKGLHHRGPKFGFIKIILICKKPRSH
jgi:hypothetical protein